MWAILKINTKELNLLKKDLENKIKDKVEIYSPQIKIEKYFNRKKKKVKFNLLGDYIFCFSKKFSKKNTIQIASNSKGLKYFLDGFENAQLEIKNFLKICSNNETEKGFLSEKFFDLKINNNYEFINGPFSSKIFKLVEIQKNKIGFKMGNIKSYITTKDIFFKPL